MCIRDRTIEDGQEIIEKQIFNRQNERIGIIDKDGNIQFVEEYKQKLQERDVYKRQDEKIC